MTVHVIKMNFQIDIFIVVFLKMYLTLTGEVPRMGPWVPFTPFPIG